MKTEPTEFTQPQMNFAPPRTSRISDSVRILLAVSIALFALFFMGVVCLCGVVFIVRTGLANRELEVVLPSPADASPLVTNPQGVVVCVGPDGAYSIDGKLVEVDEMERILREAVVRNPLNQTVVIRADKQAQYVQVVVVMDVCKRAGISDYRITTVDEN